MALFVTSDMHFGHEAIIKYCDRPFTDVEHMNDELVRLWNETVKPQDHVWVLGDAVMGDRNKNLHYISLLNGTKVLVPGNHDYVHPMRRENEKWQERYRQVFADIWTTEVTVGFGTPDGVTTVIRLCHFPYMGDHTNDERYNQKQIDKYVPKDDGMVLLHGHTHGENPIQYERQIDVGIDAWNYKPVLLNDLMPTIVGLYGG